MTNRVAKFGSGNTEFGMLVIELESRYLGRLKLRITAAMEYECR